MASCICLRFWDELFVVVGGLAVLDGGSGWLVGWLLQFYVLTTSNVISEWVPICDSAHSGPEVEQWPCIGTLANGVLVSL